MTDPCVLQSLFTNHLQWIKYILILFYIIYNFYCRKLEYTRDTLIKFKKEYEQQQKASKGSSTGGFGGFGGFGGETKVRKGKSWCIFYDGSIIIILGWF